MNRHREGTGAPRVNAKHAYRVMAVNALLLPKAPRRRQSSRPHSGTVSVQDSNTRWCSDDFEIACDSGQTVTATFAKDGCDRKILAFRAWQGKGLPGEPVREMLIKAVQKRWFCRNSGASFKNWGDRPMIKRPVSRTAMLRTEL